MLEPEAIARLKSIPVPVKVRDCVLPPTPLLLSVTVSKPLRLPPALGVKVMLMVQEPPAATLEPQLLVWLKLPLTATLLTVSAMPPLLLRLTAWASEVVPKSWPENVKLAGERLAEGTAPVPPKATVCMLPVPLSVIESTAVRLPVAEGVKVTPTVQVALGFTIADEQVSALFEKSLAFVPLIVTLATIRLAVPVLVIVMVLGALLAPTSWEPNDSVVGLIESCVAVAINTVKGEDVPPPGAGLTTVTCADPAVAMSTCEMYAVS